MSNFLLFVLLSASVNSIKNEVNMVLKNFGLPLFIFFIVVGTVIGVVQNYEKIVDKDGNGTRKEGLWNVSMIVLYVLIGCGIIGAVVKMLSNVSLSV